MEPLIIPPKICAGDTVAFISLSGGRAGDRDMIGRYNLAKSRFEEEYRVHVVETPNALRGSEFLYRHPELRWADLEWALTNPAVKGILCNMGGDDSYRILPWVNTKIIHDNPKVFMGYSDISTWMAVFAHAGVRAYYGPNVLTPIGQVGKLDAYSKEAIRKALFSNEIIGEINPCEAYTPIEWNDSIKPEEIQWTPNDGYSIVQGSGKASGRLLVMMPGPMNQIMGTKYFPTKEMFDGAVLAIEHGRPYGNAMAGFHNLRAFAAAGVFDKASAIITGKLDDTSRSYLRKVICEEVHRDDMVILENVDFVHHTPMTVLPVGALCEIDCERRTFTISEAGTC